MRFSSVLLAAALLIEPALLAQPWTPPAGQGSAWISAQTLRTSAHIEGTGDVNPNVDLLANTLTLGAEYGVSDRLALSFSLPYVSTRLNAGTPHKGSTSDDFGRHGALTDVRLEVRYKAIDAAFVLTPTLAIVVPSGEYETIGHAAPGRGLNEYAAGFDVGYNALAISPNLFVSGSYAYSYVERVTHDITVDRSNADLQFAYFVTPRLSLRAASMWQKTHGGLDFPLAPHDAEEHGHHHDQLQRAEFWRGAAALGYAITPTVDVFGSWSTVIAGANTHAFESWGVGLAWNFDASRRSRRPMKLAIE